MSNRLLPYDTIIKANKLPQRLILGSETASTVSSRGVYKFPVVGVDKVPPGGLRPVVALETYGTVQRVERQTGPRRGIWNRCHGWNGRFHLANGFIVPFGALASGYPACRRRR